VLTFSEPSTECSTSGGGKMNVLAIAIAVPIAVLVLLAIVILLALPQVRNKLFSKK